MSANNADNMWVASHNAHIKKTVTNVNPNASNCQAKLLSLDCGAVKVYSALNQ